MINTELGVATLVHTNGRIGSGVFGNHSHEIAHALILAGCTVIDYATGGEAVLFFGE